jgi:hypothetical protein
MDACPNLQGDPRNAAPLRTGALPYPTPHVDRAGEQWYHERTENGPGTGEPMSGKQWLLITFVVIVNIIIFGMLLTKPSAEERDMPAASWTPCPTFTSSPFPTATAILMPTAPPLPTTVVNAIATAEGYTVQEGDTLERIAEQYGISVYTLRMLNRLSEGDTIEAGQELLVPASP